MSEGAFLAATGVSKTYHGTRVLKPLSIELEAGKITALIGPNGAGKTTLFDIITGFVSPDGGRVLFRGRDITKAAAFRRAQLGIVKTFQIPHEFGTLSVRDNLLVAMPHAMGERFPQGLFPLGTIAEQERKGTGRAREVLEFLGLHERGSERADALSAGEKKLLELARALMLDPALLMLDEPLAGVPAGIGHRILERIVELRDRGTTVLIVEHNLEAVMRIADRVYVLVDGDLLASGTPAEVQSDERVFAAYSGA